MAEIWMWMCLSVPPIVNILSLQEHNSWCQRNKNTYEPRHDKTNKMNVCPAKTQISLGIRPVWSESSLCAQWVAKNLRFLHADSEDSDQTVRMPRLIWVFAGHILNLFVLSCCGSYSHKHYNNTGVLVYAHKWHNTQVFSVAWQNVRNCHFLLCLIYYRFPKLVRTSWNIAKTDIMMARCSTDTSETSL